VSKRKKHDPRARLRRTMAGCRIIFDGNTKQQLRYVMPNGLPMDRNMLDVAIGWAWRWEVTIGLKLRLGDAIRTVIKPIPVEQQFRLNELTEYVEEAYVLLALEEPSAWTPEARTFDVKILG